MKYAVVIAVFILGIVLLIMDYTDSSEEIQDGLARNSYGEGSRTEELEIHVGKGKDAKGELEKSLSIEISERKYKEEDIEEMFTQCIRQIEKEMPGENESLDYVTKDLNLMTELTGQSVDIDWNLDNYDVLNIYGEIQKDGIAECDPDGKGTMVHLTAVITYTENPDRQAVYECTVAVYPEELTVQEQIFEEISREIKKEDKYSQERESLRLPEAIDGKEVRYYRRMDIRGMVLIVMAVFIGFLFYIQELQNQGQEKKKRQKQMMMDYPEIINKLTLFLGAGMTIKRAWRKIVTDYEEEKGNQGVRFAYEEMKITCREMESGIAEAESYERFGKRCNIQEYVRFGALLSQNMRKGTKGLNHLLRLEAVQAFENRKAMAKKAGEEAGTRLLLPMFIMFAVVLVMVIVPAFLSMQI